MMVGIEDLIQCPIRNHDLSTTRLCTLNYPKSILVDHGDKVYTLARLSSMHLILSSGRSPWNSNYCTESGQVLFKAESPWSSSLLGRNIKISRVVPPSEVGNDFTQSLAEEAALRDVFEPLGEIEYHFFKNSRIRYRGVDQPVNQLFRQVGFGFYGR